MERTFVMFKPDCLERGLLGRILCRFEEKGLRITAMKMLRVTPDLAKQHYAEHVSKPFYPSLEEFITASPVVATVMEGPEVIRVVREMLGATSGLKAAAGTVVRQAARTRGRTPRAEDVETVEHVEISSLGRRPCRRSNRDMNRPDRPSALHYSLARLPARHDRYDPTPLQATAGQTPSQRPGFRGLQARIAFTGLAGSTPVSLESSPWNSTVNRAWSMPRRWSIVAWRSRTWTTSVTAL